MKRILQIQQKRHALNIKVNLKATFKQNINTRYNPERIMSFLQYNLNWNERSYRGSNKATGALPK